MVILISVGELPPSGAPTPPDPDDRSLGKRQWEFSTASEARPLICSPSNSRLLPCILPQRIHTHAENTHR